MKSFIQYITTEENIPDPPEHISKPGEKKLYHAGYKFSRARVIADAIPSIHNRNKLDAARKVLSTMHQKAGLEVRTGDHEHAHHPASHRGKQDGNNAAQNTTSVVAKRGMPAYKNPNKFMGLAAYRNIMNPRT